MLELYIACHHPFREKRDATDVWAKGHTDLLDPNRISPDEQPIFDAHVICSVPVARCSELPAAQNIVAFTKDYPFIMCDTKVQACLLRWQRIWPVCAGRRNTTHDKLARPGSTPLVLRGEA